MQKSDKYSTLILLKLYMYNYTQAEQILKIFRRYCIYYFLLSFIIQHYINLQHLFYVLLYLLRLIIADYY